MSGFGSSGKTSNARATAPVNSESHVMFGWGPSATSAGLLGNPDNPVQVERAHHDFGLT